MHEYQSSWWSIEAASGWLADEDPELVTISREDGVGALQIRAHKHDSGSVAADDLRNFTEDQFPDDVSLQPVSCGNFRGVGVDYVAGGRFWLKRWLYSGPLLLYVTYNSKAEHRALEIDHVNRMIATLKAL